MFNFLKKKLPPNVIESVNYSDFSTKEFYENYFIPKKPLLIQGASNDWPLMKKWNKEYIINHAGKEECTVVRDSRPAASKETSTLENYFKNLKNCSTLSLKEFNKGDKPIFFKDLIFPNKLFETTDIYRYFFFHADNNSGTLPHNHGDAFNFLVFGRKSWVMFDADPTTSPNGYNLLLQYNKKYPVGAHSSEWFASELLNIGKKKIHYYNFIQEPGEIVYIPHRYAHTVLNLDEVMGLVIEKKRYQHEQ